MEITDHKMKGAGLIKAKRLGLFYVLLIGILSLFIFLAVQSYQSIDEELTESVLSRRLTIAELSATTLSEKFDRMVDVGVALATRVQFRKLIAEGKWAEAAEILKDVVSDFPFIERVHLTSLDGIKMAELPILASGIGISYAHRDWYHNVSRNWEPYISPVFERYALPRHNLFVVAIPIKDSAQNPLGILVMHIDMEKSFTWISQIEIGVGGFIYVVDSKGQLASHPRFPAQGEIMNYSEVPSVQYVLQGQKGVGYIYNHIEKEHRVAAYAPVKFGWGVIAQQPIETAFEFKNKQLNRVLTGYILVFFFCMLVLWLIVHVLRQRWRAEKDQQMVIELEQRVAERTRQLENANKELESFSYSVSHDLRSPLRAIEGFSLILEEDYGKKLDAEGQRLLSVVKDNARKMSMLIDDLLSFSRLGRQGIKSVEINMEALVNDVLEEMRMQHDLQRVKLVEHPLPAAKGDRALLRQVWFNLFSNAVKYSSERSAPIIEWGGYGDEAEIVYYVKDNGVGFDMQYYDKLFSVFQRLHRAEDFAGTGIGLAIIKRIITRHGGRVWAEGKVNEGAVFYFTLPRKELHDEQL
ncbi:phospho-acceptor domain-containing protein [Nitrosomonas nitrosa]|uniref:histidine kinase n=1 Tax=Nitrosomonas nitrosa TaxID=52442 RepID=A0A1I4QBH9_9PROT|nr:sensor histidine kinase [Nitrosomonas nitrosa]PTQ95477.1 phospho-acceptor domain-containing protein [Nitrosomonas nitrosa]CAE6501195.1 conserved hypothetical protein [Nitrosomonas nitrosa]SFM37441.1 His Kinase A (phospho-acceptor) domain-containing protein [Nitrosomonas nitrosa]